jgi:uncharacterized protein YqgV (UPF0045/DUF77 family)
MAKGKTEDKATPIETLEQAIVVIESLTAKVDVQAEMIESLTAKVDEITMQVDDAFKKLKEVSTTVAAAPTETVVKELPKLPADSTFELDGKKYKLLIPQYSVPVAQENGTMKSVIFTAEELLQKNAKGVLKNEAHLKTLVEGKLHKYIVEVK